MDRITNERRNRGLGEFMCGKSFRPAGETRGVYRTTVFKA